MTGFGEMIFQNGMEQGEKSIVEYMMKTGKTKISAITGGFHGDRGKNLRGQVGPGTSRLTNS